MTARVLSQAGGGFMGRGPAAYLAALERELGAGPIGNRFDLLVGTSAGAINSAVLATGHTAAELLQLHRDHGAEIFGTRLWAYRLLKNGPRYSAAAVEKFLHQVLGDVAMDQTARPLYLTAWDARRKDIKVWGPTDKGMKVRDVVRCSMAAPSYFAPMWGRYVDGGLAANNPLLAGLAAGFTEGVLPAAGVRCLDLVTTGTNPERGEVGTDWNILGTLSRVILPALTAGNSADVDYIARAWLRHLPGSGTFRVSPACPDFELDETKNGPAVETIWTEQWAKDRAELLREFGPNLDQ